MGGFKKKYSVAMRKFYLRPEGCADAMARP